MTLRIPIALAIFFCLFAHVSPAQKWAEMLHDGRANFYEIQAAFEAEWSGKENERGSGWKPYKRWEYDTEERVYPSGEFPPQNILYTEYYKFMATKGRGNNAQRSSGNWEELGPKSWENVNGWNPGIGRVNFIYEEPGNQNTIYVGTPAGGLWRSEDAGQSWTPLTDELPSMGVSGIAVDPDNTDIIYIATGDRDANDYYGVGLMKSEDYGATWQTTGLNWNISSGLKCNWLIMHPEDSQILFLASNDGLYKTSDGANSWQKIITANIREVALHPTNPDIVYGVSNRFYRSEDGGESFSIINQGTPPSGQVNRLSLGVSSAAPDYVYILAGDDQSSGFHGIYRSTDAGLNFEERSTSPNILGYSSEGTSAGGQSWFDLALAVSQTNPNRLITGGINVWRSDNGGVDFSSKSHWVFPSSIGYTHADIHFLRYYGNRLYCGSDGGIFVSTDNGNSWTDLSAGIGNTQLYRMAFAESDPYNILVGTQDNGTNFLSDDTFYHLLGGDGNGAAMNNDNSDIVYAAYPYGSITYSVDGGDDFDDLSGNIEENGLWVTPMILDPSDQNVLYAGFQNVWKHTWGSGWETLGNSGGSSFRALAVAPSNSNYIYGAKGGIFHRTTDGGENWDTFSSQLPGTSITDIAVHPENPEHVIITTSGYTQGAKVYESFDAGTNFTNVSFNLPNIPANAVVFENSDYNGIYVGTDAGVFYTNDDLANWVDFMDGLPKTKVRQLLIAEGIGKVRAGTFGRGIWESDMYVPNSDLPVANFSGHTTVICAGDSIQFTDLSFNAAPGWEWSFEGGFPESSSERDPMITFFEEGVYTVSLTVNNANGEDSLTETNYVVVLGNGEIPPYSESFESISDIYENYWLEVNPDNDVSWELNTNAGFNSTQSIWLNNQESSSGRIDEVQSPSIDLSNAESAILSFKVAYAQQNTLNNDRLRLFISNNCGETWNLRGQWKGTTNLPTAPPTSDPFIPANEDEWQYIEITSITTSYMGPNFRFMFQMTNDNGNNIYIDDININVLFVGVEENEKYFSSMELYPNPARGQTNLEFATTKSQQVSYTIHDGTGRELMHKDLGQLPVGEHRITIHTHSLARGMYYLTLRSDEAQSSRKLFID